MARKTVFIIIGAVVLVAGLVVLGLALFTPATLSKGPEMARQDQFIVRYGAKKGAVDVFNPFVAGFGDWDGTGYLANEHLMYLNLFTGEITPWLASGYTYGDGNRTLTINVRKGVTWNDGQPFTANDIAFTYNMLKQYGGKLSGGGWFQQNLKDIAVPDDLTITLTFNSPLPRAHYNLLIGLWTTPIVPKHIWEKVSDPTTFKNYPDPVFTGPYKLKLASEQTYVWQRRDDYWAKSVMGKFPAAKYVVVSGLANETAVLDQIAHKMDVWCGMAPAQYKEVAAKQKTVYVTPADLSLDPCTAGPFFNVDYYPLNMPEVRWAISYAIDKKKVGDVAFGGDSIPVATWLPPYGGNQKFFDDWKDVLEKYDLKAYDPAKAEAMLAKAGFKKGADGILVTPRGTKFTVELLNANWAGCPEETQSTAEDLKKIGIDAKVKILEPTPYIQLVQQYDYQICFWNFCMEGIAQAWDPAAVLAGFTSSWLVPKGQTAQGNYARFSDREFDSIAAKVATMSPDDPAVKPLLKRALEIYLSKLYAIPYRATFKPTTFDTLYWTNYPTTQDPYMTPFHWWPEFLFVVLNIKPTGTREPVPAPSWSFVLGGILVVAGVVFLATSGTGKKKA